MTTTEQIQLEVVDELAYDPAVDSSRIAVTATDSGVVTLKGSVITYMQARLAERATKRVRNVQAVVNDLEVNPAASSALDDTRIAESALRALHSSASVPKDAVKVTVSNGWMTLEGRVEWDYQRRAASNAVRDLAGVRSVSNLIEIRPTARPYEVKEKIEGAFRRIAQLDAEHVRVEAIGNRVTLRGTVSSWTEKDVAELAAFSAPGVTAVDNRIEVRSNSLI